MVLPEHPIRTPPAAPPRVAAAWLAIGLISGLAGLLGMLFGVDILGVIGLLGCFLTVVGLYARSLRLHPATDPTAAAPPINPHLGRWQFDLEDGTAHGCPRMHRLIGLGPNETISTFSDLLQRIHPVDLSAVHTALDGTIERQLPFQASCRVRDGAGNWQAFRFRGNHTTNGGRESITGEMELVESDDHGVELLRKTSNDLVDALREKTRDAGELQDRNQVLEHDRQVAIEANRIKSVFLANMSHEIRTPMTAILGYADLLDELDDDAARRRLFAQTIRRNGEHLLSVLDDILDLSKVEAGRLDIERTDFSPGGLLSELRQTFAARAAEKRLELVMASNGELPPAIHTDQTRLRQILSNLLGNAIKFTEQGEVRLTITHDRDSNMLRCEVRDTGIGIDAKLEERIFEPFQQADGSTTRRFGGTGLGLHISRRLAELLGGSLALEPGSANGAVFALTIPAPASRVTAETSTGNLEPASACRGHILLADDGVDNRRLISHMLRLAGATVHEVPDGQAALDATLEAANRGERFDLVILDLQMPRLDGFQAVQELRKSGWKGPILALTANAMRGDREACLDAGFDEYLAKPVRRPELLSMVQRLLPPAPHHRMAG